MYFLANAVGTQTNKNVLIYNKIHDSTQAIMYLQTTKTCEHESKAGNMELMGELLGFHKYQGRISGTAPVFSL